MPGYLSRAGAQRALESGLGRSQPANPTVGANAMYLALATAAPGPTATGTEVVDTGYARQLVELNAASAADPPQIVNTNVETFGPFAAGPGSITHCFLTQVATKATGAATDMFAYWTLTSARTPSAGDSAQLASGALTLQVTDASGQ